MNYNVYANGKEIPVRSFKIFQRPYNAVDEAEYVMLTEKKGAELVIESKIEITSAVVRPLSAGITPEIREGKIFLAADKAAKLSLEINGGYENNLMVFIDEEKYADFVPDEKTIVFRRGIHDADTVVIDSDHTTLYLEDGAVLNGNIKVLNCSDVTICGRGIVCMEKYTYEMRKDFARSIDVVNCKDVKISDIIISDSNDWSLRLNGCDDVRIENVKIFGCRGNSDGIDVCGSRNVTVTNIFTRVWDDSFVVKSLGTGNSENIVFSDSVLWNDFARPIEVGVELRADRVRNIRFENIDIIHSSTGYPLMGIHHGDHAHVSDITFKNIRIEDAPGAQLFDIRIADSVWSRDNAMGRISDITFSDINYIGTRENSVLLSNSRLEGYSEEHDIRNVSFHNVFIGGRAAKSADELGLDIKGYVKNVSVTADDDAEEILRVLSSINIGKDFVIGEDGLYHGAVLVCLKNSESRRASGNARLAISPGNTESERMFDFDLVPNEKAEYEFDMTLQPGKYVFYLKSRDSIIENKQMYVSLDAVIHRNEEVSERPSYVFKNFYGNDCVSVKMSADNDGIILMPNVPRKTELVIYTALPASEVREGEIVFSAEETDFGEVCALVRCGECLTAAPQLRCPLEITYVFRNEPKVGEIKETRVTAENGKPIKLTFEELELDKATRNFIIEIAAKADETRGLRYPYTLFHSTAPQNTAHMFGNVRIVD